MAHLTILHTNDLHGALERRPGLATRIGERRRALGADGLLFDGGDAVMAGNVTFSPWGERTHDLMAEAGYDAGVVGNREFHVSEAGFRAKLKRARFPLLCANVRPRGGEASVPAQAHHAFTAGGLRVGVMGLTVPMVTERMRVRVLSAWTFEPPLEVARQVAAELRPTCDLLVCLSHCGLVRDLEMADSVPGIDLLVGGHSHSLLEDGVRVGGALVVQARSHGAYIGVVTVSGEPGALSLSAQVEPL